ncbi:MAG: TatD family hydrolase [Patescibacteria group bacterium]
MYDYFDIHSHLDFKDFDLDRDQVIEEMRKQKVATITIGVDLQTSRNAVELATKHAHLYAAVGLHPADNATESFNEADYLVLVNHPKTVAIGECGLDYARLPESPDIEKQRQKDEFEKQIAFAVAHSKPLMIHCRDAYPDVLALLASKKREYGDVLRANFHFFTSPLDIAAQILELDFTMSFTGPITFAPQYQEVVRYVPLSHMMAETDSPFAAPVPYRGKRNSPLYVEEIVKKIAEIKGKDLESVKQALMETTLKVFFRPS